MIPKIIHYCWFGGNEIPEKEQKCINSWKKFCPDYKIIEWNETNYDIGKNIYIKQAAEAKKWAFVSDYVRLDVIYQFGGIYLDTDVEVIRSLDPLLKHKAFAGMENVIGEEFSITTGSGFGAEKQNPIIDAWRKEYDTLIFRHSNGTEDLLTTPARTTAYMKSLGFQQKNVLQEINGMVIYPTDYFSPKQYNTGKIVSTDNTYSIHHYSESWKTDDQKKKNEEWFRLRNKYGESRAELIMAIKDKYKEGGMINIFLSAIGMIFNRKK